MPLAVVRVLRRVSICRLQQEPSQGEEPECRMEDTPQTPKLPQPMSPGPPVRALSPAPCITPIPGVSLPPQPRASRLQSPDALVEDDSCPEALREVRTLVEVGGPSSEGEEDPNKGLREETQVESPNKALLVAQRTQAWRSGRGEPSFSIGWIRSSTALP